MEFSTGRTMAHGLSGIPNTLLPSLCSDICSESSGQTHYAFWGRNVFIALIENPIEIAIGAQTRLPMFILDNEK